VWQPHSSPVEILYILLENARPHRQPNLCHSGLTDIAPPSRPGRSCGPSWSTNSGGLNGFSRAG
jgi:hypothetical protein